jgi:hypothetical protein
MNQPAIDGLARTLGTRDRRASLKSLALGLAEVGAAPLAAGAKKNNAGKEANKKCK